MLLPIAIQFYQGFAASKEHTSAGQKQQLQILFLPFASRLKSSIQSLGCVNSELTTNYIRDAKTLVIQASLIIWSPSQSAQKACCSLVSHPFCVQLFGGCELFHYWDRASILYYYNSLWDITVMLTTETSLINNASFYSWLPQPTFWERLPRSEISFSRTGRATHYIRTLQSAWTCKRPSQCKGNIEYMATDCSQLRIRFCNFHIIFTSQVSTSSCIGHRQLSYPVSLALPEHSSRWLLFSLWKELCPPPFIVLWLKSVPEARH